MLFNGNFSSKISQHFEDSKMKGEMKKTSPACITKRMSASSSANPIKRVAFKTNPAVQLSNKIQ